MKPIILTYIWCESDNEISSTSEFRRSVAHFGYDLINVHPNGAYFKGHGEVFQQLYHAICNLPPDQMVVYSDGADTFFLREIEPPTDRILYSTEKAYYPTDGKQDRYTNRLTPWCYLNGGGWSGPAGMVKEYFERFGLAKLKGDINGQQAQHNAYFAALDSGFPVDLDQLCNEFQTIAFQADGDFSTYKSDQHGAFIINNLTGSTPALFHGNGRTPMGWVYDLLPKKPNA